MQVPEVTPEELQLELESANPPALLDVREDDELETSKLPFTYHIPLGSLLDRIDELDPEENLVVYCRSGGRSGQAAGYLQQNGFKKVRNLATGINGWAATVDPTMKRY